MPQNQDSFVHFTLKRSGWGYEDIYEALKKGKKTSEWRDATDFWAKRLLNESGLQRFKEVVGFTYHFYPFMWKHKRARFVVGYTSYPRLLADIEEIIYHSDTKQFEIRIENVIEVKSGISRK